MWIKTMKIRLLFTKIQTSITPCKISSFLEIKSTTLKNCNIFCKIDENLVKIDENLVKNVNKTAEIGL